MGYAWYVNVHESEGITVVGRQRFRIVDNVPLDPSLIPTDD